MIEVNDVLISDDIKNSFFVCNLEKCKGACCVEGDLGAPLEEEELEIIEEIYDIIKPYLTQEGIAEIEKQGKYVIDIEDELSTPTINNTACAYAIYDKKNILKCTFEQAYMDGKTTFKKPISCHLYPIRSKKYATFTALNYDKWEICSDACVFGEKLQVPVYKFLKEPLERKFGEEWYNGLEKMIEEE